jgi:hypothetical protein
MKKIALALLLMCTQVFAQGAPATVSFTARLQDNGLPLMGNHDFVFALYDAATGGNQKYTQTIMQQPIGADGMLYLDLGPFSATQHFTGPALYLEITIDGTVSTPRILIESVPYALRSGKAGDADGLGGSPAASWQKSVTSTCTGTNTIQTINQDGSVTCSAGPVYTALTGGGLLLSSNMFSVDPTVYQKRIVGCASGAIASVAADGTATCIAVGPTYTPGSGIAISAANVISADNTIQRALSSTCSASSFLNTFSQTGASTCITAGTGLTVATGTVTVDTATIQARVTGTCSGGQAIQSISSTGTVTCGGGAASGIAAGRLDTPETTTSTTYTDLATTGPTATVTIGASGAALVTVTGHIQPGASNQTAFMSFQVSGASSVAANDSQALIRDFGSSGGTGYIQASATFYVTGLTGGANAFTAKYKTTAGTATFADRNIIVHPL